MCGPSFKELSGIVIVCKSPSPWQFGMKGKAGIDELGKKEQLRLELITLQIFTFDKNFLHQNLTPEPLRRPAFASKTAFCFAHMGLFVFYIYTVFLSGLA